MSNSKHNSNSNNKKDYPPEIEAAWYALICFISTSDYVVRIKDKDGNNQIITVNPNCVLASQISKNGLLKPQRITKSDFINHFNRDVIIFYKCRPNSRLTTGYGRNDKQALALPFSAELGVTTKKLNDPDYYVLLIGIDIDCHNGERHVNEVEALIKKYLPNTYWEASTNGNGRHGYLKIKFLKPSFGVLDKIIDFLEKLFARLNELKSLHGYEAKIDDPAGLPYKMELTDNNPYIENWNALTYTSGKEERFLGRWINPKSEIWKDYVSYLKCNTTYRVPEECYSRPSILSKYISLDDIKSSFFNFLAKNSISFPAPTKNKKYYKITYRRALKLPMFGATVSECSDSIPSMACIKEFHAIPYYTSSELFGVYHQLQEDVQLLRNSASVYLHYYGFYHLFSGSLEVFPVVDNLISSSESDLDLFSGPIPVKAGIETSSNQNIKKNSILK